MKLDEFGYAMRKSLLTVTVLVLSLVLLSVKPGLAHTYYFGSLASGSNNYQNLASRYNAGVRVVVLELAWSDYETADGAFNTAYISSLKSSLAADRAAGMQVVLDPGCQYPPDWLFKLPNSHYIDQYGDAFVPQNSGDAGPNFVFNAVLRGRLSGYLHQIFADLGTNFLAVRLGMSKYGELCYPYEWSGRVTYNGHQNPYWGFDPIAQGYVPGLPSGMSPCPVPGWIPGTPSANHSSAIGFAQWYMNSMKNWHDWQIATVRKYYPGKLAMLYPSWGIRPGQLTLAEDDDLNGSSSPERNGEIQRGHDFARFIAGIKDPDVILYTTWLDAGFANDTTGDQTQWSQAHWFSYLGLQNPLHLRCWGENTGSGGYGAMQLCVNRMTTYGLLGMNWAFDDQLSRGPYATLDQYANLISQTR